MNERIKALAERATEYATTRHPTSSTVLSINNEKFEQRFAELIVAECLSQCEKIAVDADAMTKSKFVTDAGRMLHEGMWGGAKNCAAEIKQHFGVE